jgi:hypothetical protein
MTFGILSKSEASSYPRCPRHAHHTVTVRNWLHLYQHNIIGVPFMSSEVVMANHKKDVLGSSLFRGN